VKAYPCPLALWERVRVRAYPCPLALWERVRVRATRKQLAAKMGLSLAHPPPTASVDQEPPESQRPAKKCRG